MKKLNHNVIKIKNPETGKYEGLPAIVGESAYDYAVKGGYTGTEEEFSKKMAEEGNTGISEEQAQQIATNKSNIELLQAQIGDLIFGINEEKKCLTVTYNI